MEHDLPIRSEESPERSRSEKSESSSTGEDRAAEPAGTQEHEELVELAATGDLRLRLIGPKPRVVAFLVCSKILVSVSPVFKRMLDGASGRPLGDGAGWMVSLPHDSIQPMEILLSIAHGQHQKVPGTLLIADLSLLVVASHKYDMTALLKPWARSWIRSPEVLMSGGDLRLLHIAWELGALHLYKKTMLTIIMNCCETGSDGRLAYPRDRSEEAAGDTGRSDSVWNYKDCDIVRCGCISHLQHLRPADLREQIQSCRDTIMKAKLEPLYAFYERLQKGMCSCENIMERYRCMALAYGSLAMSVENLLNAGVSIAHPEPIVPKSYSVVMVGRLIADFKVEALCDSCVAEIERIWEEGGSNERAVISTLKLWSSSDLQHMAAQAKKTDVSQPETWLEHEGGRGG